MKLYFVTSSSSFSLLFFSLFFSTFTRSHETVEISAELSQDETTSDAATDCSHLLNLMGTDCSKILVTHDTVHTYCVKLDDASMTDRCCFNNQTGELLGLDLKECKIESTHVLSKIKSSTSTVKVISLADNNDLKKVSKDDFQGMVSLDVLELPSDCSCPGYGVNTWSNITTEKLVTTCSGQKSECDEGFECPGSNSVCQPDGPGQQLCVCDSTHEGYKCMRSTDKFPWKIYAPIWATTTLIITTFLSWKRFGQDYATNVMARLSAMKDQS